MRLLQLGLRDELSITHYDEDKLPPYAILSHTWGADDDEVTFEDVKRGSGKSKAGYAKIIFCGQQAQRDDLKHFWVDSCCINKSSDTELSESLNSMFRWYKAASKCYVYLQDVSARKRDSNGHVLCNWEAAFQKSRWFTRGWTLQELLAPRVVEFWSRDKSYLGTKEALKDLISAITNIPQAALCGRPLLKYTTYERLRWAANRDTKRKEDKAYCLLGIFGVFLSPIYGEGEHAFTRLKKKIAKASEQHLATLQIPGANARSDHSIAVSTEEAIQPQQVQRRQHHLASLSFDQIDSRQATIRDAERTTCEWILQHDDYVAWNDRDKPLRQQEILWIAGKPGAGKSTIMKFAYSRAKKARLRDEIILSFFFNARGDDLEKTTLGMYRSLLVQLLNEAPDLQTILDDIDSSSPTGTQTLTWTYDLLQNLLRTAVGKLGTRRLKLFIDALDECDELQILHMVDFLEELTESIQGNACRLYICFASRHYPTINLNDGLRLVLEDQDGHDKDLQKYIQRRLKAGKGKRVSEIQARVQEKSNGVFMWVVLVVDILNREFRHGRIFAVEQRLQEIPAELKNLFKDLIRRDAVNMDELLLCIQWIVFAARPLRREEFYFAMRAVLRRRPNHIVNSQPQPRDSEEVVDEDMERFVRNSSKGLAELTKSGTNRTVQFIHETVPDFLVKDGGLYELWPELEGKLNSLSHERLKKCCSDYMAADVSSYVPLPETLPEASSKEAKELQQQMSTKFPFLEYASKHVLYHANEAACGVAQEDFLDAFALTKWIRIANVYERRKVRRYGLSATLCYITAENGFSRLLETLKSHNAWIRLPEERYQVPAIVAFANGHPDAMRTLLGDDAAVFLDEITKDPGFGKPSEVRRGQDLLLWTIKNKNWAFARYLIHVHSDQGIFTFSSKTRQDQRGRTALELAAEHGVTTIVQLLLDRGADVNAPGGHYGNALYAASQGGHEGTVQLLLDGGADVNAQGGHYGNALYAASQRGHEGTVQLLLDGGADINAQGGKYGNALRAASFHGHEGTVQLLLDRGADVNAQGGDYGNALQAASQRGHERAVQLLLDRGADVNAQGGYYGKALYAASQGGHERTVQLLLDGGADANAQGGDYGNALQAASQRGHERAVQLLLDGGANVNAQRGKYGNALYVASFHGHEGTVQLLLDRGADVNAQGGKYGNALYAASQGGHERTVQLLLDRGADVNAQGGYFGNALYAASQGGHERTVQLLLDGGANINAQGGKYGNALYAASKGGHEGIVQLLLDGGADINAQGGYFGNALQAAAFQGGHERTVQLLLDRGADVNAQGGGYGKALQAASQGGHERTVQLLLDRGADINAQGGYYGNALQAAAFQGGHEGTVQLLLDRGADVNAQGGYFGNALQAAASQRGHERAVQLLLDRGADINAQGGKYGNALYAASFHGHEGTVQLLLDGGADVNAQGGYYGNALQAAASQRGHEGTVQLLLDGGADINAQGGKYGKALQAASQGGHKRTMQLLLDRGANVNA